MVELLSVVTRNLIPMTINVPHRPPSRQQLFRAALAIAGITGTQWAEEQGVTRQHVWQVLAGVRESKTLTEAVDAFIAKHTISRSVTAA